MDIWLGRGATFGLYGIFALCGFIFIYKYVPETKGLSEKEKKKLFLPGGKFGRKLGKDESRGPISDSDSGMMSLDSDKLSEQIRAARNDQIAVDRKNLLQINESLLSSSDSTLGPANSVSLD